MRGRRNKRLELQLVDLRDLQKRIGKIRKRKAGIYKRWGITKFDERKGTNKLQGVPIAVGFDLKEIVFYGELPMSKKLVGERRFELPTSWSRRKLYLLTYHCRSP